MNLLTYFLGFPGPFTSSLPLIVPIGLLLHYLGFLGPFISSLPLIILVGMLAFIPTIPVCWACSIIFSSYFLHIVGLLLLVGQVVKKWASTMVHLSSIKVLYLTSSDKWLST